MIRKSGVGVLRQQRSTMQVHRPSGDREPEPYTTCTFRPRPIDPEARHPQTLQRLLWHTLSPVANRDQHLTFVLVAPKLDA
jgi:hypothetical protein